MIDLFDFLFGVAYGVVLVYLFKELKAMWEDKHD